MTGSDERGAAADSAERGARPAAPLWKIVLRVLAGVLALALVLLVARQAGGYVPRFAQWVDGLGLWGPFVYVVGYALATVAFVPGSLLTLAGGAIFGLAQGTVLVFSGATLGSTAAFLVARYLARAAIERRLAANRRFAAIDAAVARSGFRIVFLLRLSPAFPFVLLNYGLGLTRVKLRDFVLASVGMLPGSLLYVYYGKVAGDVVALAAGGAAERGPGHYVVLGLGLLATLVVTTLVTRIARRALRDLPELEAPANPPP